MIKSALPILLAATAAHAVAASSFMLCDLPLLFADDSGLAARSGVVRTLHPARTRSAPVLVADRPWEGNRVYVYGTARYDETSRKFVLWYLARPGLEQHGSLAGTGDIPGLRHHGFDVVLYATSDDGVRWTKPALGVHAFRGSTANNIVFDLHSPSVLFDRFATDPGARYKMLGSSPEGYRAAVSADGIHWRDAAPEPVLAYADTITLAQDPNTGEYLAYHKRPAHVRGFDRRVVWLARSRDFLHWSEPELVLAPDEADDDWTRRPGERTEIYDLSVYPHAGGFIGLAAVFRVMRVRAREELSPGQSPLDGPLDIQLATSADGRNWRRSWPRLAMIPRGAPGAFDAGAILGVSSAAVSRGDETWVYYTAITTGHGAPMPTKRLSIGRAEWRRDGFVSLDAGPDGGRIETEPLTFSSPALIINADAAKGELRVALCEPDGSAIDDFGLADCVPLRTDTTHGRITWKNHAAPPTDRPVKVVIEMTDTRLYSLRAGEP